MEEFDISSCLSEFTMWEPEDEVNIEGRPLPFSFLKNKRNVLESIMNTFSIASVYCFEGGIIQALNPKRDSINSKF